MHPRDSSILTCPLLYLQAGALLWDISCYLKALRKPQVTQTVLEDEYMCRIIAPLWHMKQHFVKACDRGRTVMLRKEGKKWLCIDPVSQHMLAHLHGFSPWGTLHSHTSAWPTRWRNRKYHCVRHRQVGFLAMSSVHWLTDYSLLSQLHKAHRIPPAHCVFHTQDTPPERKQLHRYSAASLSSQMILLLESSSTAGNLINK